MIRAALVVLLATAACSELDHRKNDFCGNGVRDLDEDCDISATLDPRCVACAIKCLEVPPPKACDGLADGDPCALPIGPGVCEGGACIVVARCPPGYGCGADEICHAPGGAFNTKTTETSFPVNDYVVSDVNQDRIGDVIGLTATSVRVKLGAFENPFASEYSTLTPFGRGRAAFTLLDSDTNPDIVLPTNDGLIAFSSPINGLAPHAFSFNPGGGMDMGPPGPVVVFSLDPSHVAFMRNPDAGPGISLSTINVTRGNSNPTQQEAIICSNLGVTDNLQFDTYQLASAPPDIKVVVALNNGVDKRCSFLITLPPEPALFSITALRELTHTSTLPPVLADLSDTGCPSLVTAPGVEYKSSGTFPACALDALPSTLPNTMEMGAPIGRVKLVPAVPGSGADALATTRGVFAIQTDRLDRLALYTSDRPLTRVASGDIDNDGTVDAVAIGDDAGLDVLFRAPLAAFLLYRIGTSGRLTNVSVDDYDGNFSDDIVFTEQLAVGERLLVAYGTRDRPLDPLQVGLFNHIEAFLPVQIIDTLDRNGLVADLAVLDQIGPIQVALTILHGSPQRTMVSYFDPRDLAGVTESQLTGVVGGHFAMIGPPDVRDVIALEWVGRARLYNNFGTGNGALGQQIFPLPMMRQAPIWFELTNVTLDFTTSTDENQFWLADAELLAVPSSPVDLVIGVDRSANPTAIIIDPDPTKLARSYVDDVVPNLTGGPAVRRAEGLHPENTSLVIHSLRTADLDANGVADVLAAYRSRPDAEQPSGEVRVCMNPVNFDMTECKSLAIETIGFADARCIDVAPARVAIRGHRSAETTERMPMVALCDGIDTTRGLYRLEYVRDRLDPPTFGFRAFLLTTVADTVAQIEIGDVNGDAVDDILVLDRSPNSVFDVLRVYLQCTSIDKACLAKPPAPVEGAR